MLESFEALKSIPAKTLKWLILTSILLAGVSFILIWYGQPSFSEKDVVLKLEGPTQASSGDEAVYKLTYQNNTRYVLQNLKFRFTYPTDSVIIRNSVVSSDDTESFDIDKLNPGDIGVKEFRAFLVGDKGNIKEAKVGLIFSAGNLRSAFEKSATVSTAIVSLPVSLTLVAPPSTVVGENISYILDYRNESANDISDVQFEFKYPDGFTFAKGTPSPSIGQNVWTLPLLRRGSGARILVEGKMSGNERDVKTLSVVLKRKINDQYINYEKAETTTVISSPLLFLDVRVNDSLDYAAVVNDQLRYTIRYQNNFNQSLIGLSLAVKLDGDMYDFSNMETGGGFFDGSTNTLLFNAGSIPDFASLTPGKAGRVDFRVKLKSAFPAGASGARNFFVKATAVASTPNVPTGIDATELAVQSSLVTKISTQPTLAQPIYYNDPAFGSSGPLPLQVDSETVFTVHWQLVNPGNDMNIAKVTATLPSGTMWKNVVSSGINQAQPVYDRNKSEVSWNVGVLPQGTGIWTPKYEATFQISVKPGVNERNNVLTLLKNSLFSGTDSFTKQNIIVRIPDATSSVLADRPGEGVVR